MCRDEEESASGPPQTLADLVEKLNALPKNSDLVISYQPAETGRGEPAARRSTTTLSTDNVFNGYFSAQTARVTVEAHPATGRLWRRQSWWPDGAQLRRHRR